MGGVELEHLWPDSDRRDAALVRLAERCARPSPDHLTPQQGRVLTAISHGCNVDGAAELLGVTRESVKHHLKHARHRLAAKTTTHAVAIALRTGAIR